MNFTPYVVVLAVLTVAIMVLLAYRRKLTAWEDDTLHFHDGDEALTKEQALRAEQVAKVDLAGKILTAIVVVGALALGLAYTYITQFADSGVKMS